MADQMQFTRQKPNGGAWDFNPGNRMLQINDIRIDRETRQLLLDLFGLGGEQFIDAVLDVIAGSNGIIIERVDDIITISVDPLTMPDFDEAARDALAAALVAGPGITITPNDPDNVITIEVALDDSALLETIRDTISAAAVAGSGIIVTVDDPGNTLTITLDQEVVRDAIDAHIVAGTGLTKTVDDAGDTVTLALTTAVPTTENIQDIVGALLAASTGITVTYDDAGNVETIGIDTSVIDERARDALGAALVAGDGMSITVDDAGNTITLTKVGRPINDQTGTTYTLVLADRSKWVRLNNASAITVTVPKDVFSVGDEIEGSQAGAGQVTFVGASGVTVNGAPGLKVAAQYGVWGLKCVATNVFTAYGRLSA